MMNGTPRHFAELKYELTELNSISAQLNGLQSEIPVLIKTTRQFTELE